ncbi:hypothetical protein HJFPF1_05953 [Paramyrothecium foliicola]|nr:hypothetical protein HJFPF1_05953 [Paramyrothecium foliicola]
MVDPTITGPDLPTHLKPEGLAAAVLGITIALGALAIITVTLRSFVRVTTGQFGTDDGLMLLGMLLFVADCGVVSYDTYVGLGSKDDLLNVPMQLQGIKYVIMWQIFYVTSLCAIKCAICITLLRIAIVKAHRIAVYGIVVMTCITSLIGFVGVLTVCRPVSANWEPGTGVCASTDVITNLSYLVSASSIVTDWACAIVPIFILWNTQMKIRTKFSVAIILTLGAIASITTIARMPLLKYYKEPENNYLYHMGFVILLSIGECGIGLIAGSLPMLRRLIQGWLGKDDSVAAPTPNSNITFGGTGPSGQHSRGRFNNPTDKGMSRATVKTGRGSGEWEQLDDGNSSNGETPKASNYIMEQRTVMVEYEMGDLQGTKQSRTSSTERLRK